jgi:hypothetical protein
MVIPPLFYSLPRRNGHSTFVLLTTKKKWSFHLWFTDYQEEMAISPLFD